jgi:hypothetical protein
MCEDDPSAFCNMIAKLVPKEFQLSEDAGSSFTRIWQYIAENSKKAEVEAGEGE